MAGTDAPTYFRGTIKESRAFLARQLTQEGRSWVTRNSLGQRIYLT